LFCFPSSFLFLYCVKENKERTLVALHKVLLDWTLFLVPDRTILATDWAMLDSWMDVAGAWFVRWWCLSDFGGGLSDFGGGRSDFGGGRSDFGGGRSDVTLDRC
jgi:hypothetical protein